MRFLLIIILVFAGSIAHASVVINEIQISPINERFIELYNSGNTDVDLTGWYIQRKTETGSNFDSLVTSTQFAGKTIKANGYFLISRSQSGNSNIVVDKLILTELNTIRVRDSKGVDVDQVKWESMGDGKSYQRTSAGGWIIATPTPGIGNSASSAVSSTVTVSSQNTIAPSPAQTSTGGASSSFAPHITVDVGQQTRTALVGAPVAFEGRMFVAKKESIEKVGFIWNFNDGTPPVNSEKTTHTYSDSGEYTVTIQLDPASGYYSELYRIRVIVVAPNITLQTGGDGTSSFVLIENRAEYEIDLSGWQVSSGGKTFIFYPNTLLVARGTIKLSSDKTGLTTPVGTLAFLHFPNGTLVHLQSEKLTDVVLPSSEGGQIVSAVKRSYLPSYSEAKPVTKSSVETPGRVLYATTQNAAIADAITDSHGTETQEGNLWLWYTGVALLAVLSILGLRFSRPKRTLADEFEIIEEKDENPW